MLKVYDSVFSKSEVGLALDFASDLTHHTLTTLDLYFHKLKKCIVAHRGLGRISQDFNFHEELCLYPFLKAS